MDQTVNLPDIGEGVQEGEVIEWLKKVGDPVEKDEPVVIVMTDKATVELPSPYKGVLATQFYKAGEIAKVHRPLYAVSTGKSVEEKPVAKVLAAPATRRVAKELGVDINQVAGSGPEGRVEPKDLAASSVTLEGDERVALHGIRRAMVKKMTESKRTIPHFSYFSFADATRLLKLKMKLKEKGVEEGINVTFMPFFIKALSKTALKFPSLNSSIDVAGNTLILHKQHNVGIAIAKEEGLIVPVLKRVESMNLADVIRAYDALVSNLKIDRLSPDLIRGGTITISNFGTLGSGGRWATPIINPPEVAILAVAKIDKQPVVKNDKIVAQDTLKLSWSFDHRVIDGDMAASISSYFVHLIENPAELLN